MAPTGYLPARRSAIHESGAGAPIGIEITVLAQPDAPPPCGECSEFSVVALASALIRYRSPVMRIVIHDAVCLADLPGRVAGLAAAGIEILDVGLYSPAVGNTTRLAVLHYERTRLVERLFTETDPELAALVQRRYAATTDTLRRIAAITQEG